MYRYHEKKLSFAEIVSYLKRIRSSNHAADALMLSSSSHNHFSRSESRSASVTHHENHARKINITFLTEDKINASNKRRYENQVIFGNSLYFYAPLSFSITRSFYVLCCHFMFQIMNSVSRCLQKITNNVKVEVIAMDIEEEIIKALILSLDMEPKNNNCLPATVKR